MGGAAQAGDPPQDRRRAVGRDTRAGQEIAVPVYVEVAQPKPAKAATLRASDRRVLLGYGVPAEWLADVRQANEDTHPDLSDHLPSEAAEALLELATGGKPQIPQPVPAGANPFAHPDALRRFRVMNDVEELERALHVSLGKMDDLPAPIPAGMGGA